MRALQNLLDLVHHNFQYTPDIVSSGKLENWSPLPADIPDGFQLRDDCEGFAMYCRLLIMRDLPQYKTQLIICKILGEGHCILRVTSDTEEYFLDNRYKTIMTLDQLVREGYVFMLASGYQPGDPYYWVVAEKNT